MSRGIQNRTDAGLDFDTNAGQFQGDDNIGKEDRSINVMTTNWLQGNF